MLSRWSGILHAEDGFGLTLKPFMHLIVEIAFFSVKMCTRIYFHCQAVASKYECDHLPTIPQFSSKVTHLALSSVKKTVGYLCTRSVWFRRACECTSAPGFRNSGPEWTMTQKVHVSTSRDPICHNSQAWCKHCTYVMTAQLNDTKDSTWISFFLSLSVTFILSLPYFYKPSPWVCCMTLIASSSPLLPLLSLYSKSQSLTNTFNIPETPAAQHQSPSQDEAKAETIRNLRKSFASLFSVE